MPKGTPIRIELEAGTRERAPTLRQYAAEKLRIHFSPDSPRVLLDAETKLTIDACALVQVAVTAHAPQNVEKLRAIFRAMLQGKLDHYPF